MSELRNSFKKTSVYWILLIVGVTIAVYAPGLKFPFYPNLDDGRLILNNPVVLQFSDRMVDVFTEFVYGLYHPLTTLSFILDFHLFENNAFGFRIHNLLLHLINTVLVFFFISYISKNKNLAVFVSLIFALHPMHVESVIWISERKDVLFTLFFLLSLLSYLKWTETKRKLWWIITFTLFLFSLLSKATAVVLPLILIIIDYIRNENFGWKHITSKWMFFIVSVLFGIVNIKAQQSIDFIQPIADDYTIGQLITMPVYSFTWYITQLFVPVGLSIKNLYPRIIEGQMALGYYSGWIWLVSLIVLTYQFRKNRFFLAGMLFYAFSIGLVIKIIPTGNDLVSDRYSYVPYIGLAMALGSIVIPKLGKRNPMYLHSFFGIVIIVLGFASLNQTKHWKDEIAIWSRVIDTEPELPLAYFERGRVYQNNQQYEKALQDFQQTLKLDSNFYQSHIQLGICYYLLQQNESALLHFSEAIALAPENAVNYYHRGLFLTKMGKFDAAIPDFNKSIELGYPATDIFFQKGLAEKQLRNWEQSIRSFTIFLEKHPDHSQALTELASAYYQNRQYDLAATFYQKLLLQKPQNMEVTYLLANTYARLERYPEAIANYHKVLEEMPENGSAYLNRGNAYHFMGEDSLACNDWLKAKQLGVAQAESMIRSYCH